MKIKLVSDSSSNINEFVTEDIAYAPLKVVFGGKEYVDTPDLDVDAMMTDLKNHKGTSATACPGIQDWLDTFSGADVIYGVTLSTNISGSYNSALIASEEYKDLHPDAKIYIHDSLSAGPELGLILEKYHSLIKQGLDFDEVCSAIKEYSKHTHQFFFLHSIDNFARNGRVSTVVAKAVGVLGLCIVGKASDAGTLEPITKCRGEKKSIAQIYSLMRSLNYNGGKVRLAHTKNLAGAEAVAAVIRKDFPDCDITIVPNRGLCSYYTEEGAVLIGFEDGAE